MTLRATQYASALVRVLKQTVDRGTISKRDLAWLVGTPAPAARTGRPVGQGMAVALATGRTDGTTLEAAWCDLKDDCAAFGVRALAAVDYAHEVLFNARRFSDATLAEMGL